MSMVRNTVIVAAVVGSFAGLLLASGFERRSLMLAAAGIGPMLVFWFLMWYAISHIEYERQATRPRPKPQPTPVDTSHRADKWHTMLTLIHDWAENGFMSAGDGNPTGIAPSRELAQQSKLPFSSEIWGEARHIALEMRYNGMTIFAMQRGKGGEQLVVVQRIPGKPFNHIEQEWQRVAGKHIVRSIDKRAAATY